MIEKTIDFWVKTWEERKITWFTVLFSIGGRHTYPRCILIIMGGKAIIPAHRCRHFLKSSQGYLSEPKVAGPVYDGSCKCSTSLVFPVVVRACNFGVRTVLIARGQCDVRLEGWVGQMSYKTPGRQALNVAQTLGTGLRLALLALNNLSAPQRVAFTEIHGFGQIFRIASAVGWLNVRFDLGCERCRISLVLPITL